MYSDLCAAIHFPFLRCRYTGGGDEFNFYVIGGYFGVRLFYEHHSKSSRHISLDGSSWTCCWQEWVSKSNVDVEEKQIFTYPHSIGLKYPSSQKMYQKNHDMTEKIGKIVGLLMMHISVPVFVMPKAILSYFNYYTTDLGSHAFELTIPIW